MNTKFKFFKRRIIFIIVILICLSGQASNTFLTNRKIVVSIDSLFILKRGFYDDSSLNNNNKDVELEEVVTNYVDSILKRVASIHGFILLPNYKLQSKRAADYSISGSFGKRKAPYGFFKDSIVYFINSRITDCFTKKGNKAFFGALKVNSSKSDLYVLTNMLGKYAINGAMRNASFVNAFIPTQTVLNPENSDTTNLSFSINHQVQCGSKCEDSDKQVARLLTNILNNIIVFNQPIYPNGFNFPSKYNYDYFPNYRRINKKDRKAKFDIKGILVLKNDSTYELKFSFPGEGINLIVPAKIKTSFTLNKKRILKYHNYGEVLLKLHQIFPQVLFQQRF